MQNVVSVPVHLLFTVKPYTSRGSCGQRRPEAYTHRAYLYMHSVHTRHCDTALILCTCDAACEPDGLSAAQAGLAARGGGTGSGHLK